MERCSVLENDERRSPANGPLHGKRVVDLTSVVFGAYGTSILGDLGADVIKVEAPAGATTGPAGDVMRYPGRLPEGAAPGLGPIFLALNRNKRSIALDLTDGADRQKFLDLVATADVFVSNIRASALGRLGLSYETLLPLNPSLIYVHAAGYGAGGAYEGLPAYDDIIQAQSGFADLSRRTGHTDPAFVPSLIGDKTAGLFLAYSVIAALLHRVETGKGQRVDVPMFECLTSFLLVEHLFNQTYVPSTGDWSYPRVAAADRKPYRTLDGHIAVMPYSDENWRDFFRLTEADDALANDVRLSSFEARSRAYIWIYKAIEPLLLARTTEEWLGLFLERASLVAASTPWTI